MKIYSTSAFRSFKNFIGELTSVSAGMNVGISRTIAILNKSNAADPWQQAALEEGIIVSGLKSAHVLDGVNRLGVVSLYSGFDLFLSDSRSQFHMIHGREWVQYDGDGPFDALFRNSVGTKTAFQQHFGSHRIASIDYYRLVRNAIAHPSKEALQLVRDFYVSESSNLTLARTEYGMQSAPNSFENINFHDLKFFARVSLDVAELIETYFDPGNERLALLVPSGIIKMPKSKIRVKNAIKGWLCCTYGIGQDRANSIIAEHMTHQLGG